jgi:hypothetical protein
LQTAPPGNRRSFLLCEVQSGASRLTGASTAARMAGNLQRPSKNLFLGILDMPSSQEYERSYELDRKYRAKIVLVMVIGCIALWGAIGYLAFRSF